jgi:hypothetical protein
MHACMLRRASGDGTYTSRRGGLASADSTCAGEVPLALVPQAGKSSYAHVIGRQRRNVEGKKVAAVTGASAG